MAKKMLIDATHAEETRVVVVDGNKVEEFDFESQAKRQLAGNIYLAKVTRVEPSLQAAFVDYGGNRHGFLAFSEIHPDYYRIPVADREALIAEERAYAEAMRAEAEAEEQKPKRKSRSRSRTKAADAAGGDAVASGDPAGMETIDLDESPETEEGSSPMELVAETPVETPGADEIDADEAADDSAAAAEANGTEAGADEGATAADRDETIESVAEEDDIEDVRPVRKPRPRKYKIQEVIKTGQILLIQVVKEERGNKGAALTTYLSLAGRYCVLMPNTARGGGISRKITNAADRKKLKEIAGTMDVPEGAGLIIRTAGSQRTKGEIKRDYEYLQRLWEQIRELTLKSIAPAPIYEEGNLITRSIRDLYSKEIDEVIVEGDGGYRAAKDFMKMIMPSHARNVKPYSDPLPLFARYQVESYLNSMFNPTVQLPSGGYIVIGVTEALVAIDVNSGRATKEGSIEQTALKTNLEAADEVARQLRLRDLAGLIVIDFIDMDERKNNAAVEKRLKDRLKTDRARIQVGRISGFGLLEMSRQRLRPGMLEATTQPCPHCHGTGLLRSDDNVALSILRQIEEEGVRGKSREVLVKAPVAISNYLMNQKREHVAGIEARYGLSVRIEGDPFMVSPDYAIEKFKTATRSVAEVAAPVISVDMAAPEEEDEDVEDVEAEATEAREERRGGEGPGDKPRKRRRRRRRRKGGGDSADMQDTRDGGDGEDAAEAAVADDTAGTEDAETEDDTAAAAEDAPKPKRTRTRSRSRRKTAETAAESDPDTAGSDAEAVAEAAPEAAPEETADATPVGGDADAASGADAAEAAPKPKKPARKRASRAKSAKAETATPAEPETAPEPDAPAEAAAEAVAEQPAEAETEPQAAEPVAAETAPEPAVAEAAPAEAASPRPRRRGWWNVGR